MKQKLIIFTIDDGEVTCETSGFTGPACEAATKAFEDALGGPITGKVKKAEYFQRTAVAKTIGAGQS